MLTKLCPRCRRFYIPLDGKYCVACTTIVEQQIEQQKAAAKKKYNKEYDKQRDPKYVKFYHSNEWERLKNEKLAAVNGLCEKCLAKDKIKPASDVHHMIPIQTEEGWQRRLDYLNLVALCTQHHNEVHKRFVNKKVKRDD